MTRDPAYLLDILNEARLVLEFAQGMELADLKQDRLRQRAIVHSIMILGEAARRISQDFRDSHPEIPWTNIVGMRSQIIHEYDQISLDIVWRTIQVSIPELIALIEPLVPPDTDTQHGGEE